MNFTQFKEVAQKIFNTNFDRAFGLDISDTSIELIELNKLIGFKVQTYGRLEMPINIIKEGKILDEKILSEQIKLLLKQVTPARVSTNKVILSLPDTQVITRTFVLPAPAPRDMRTAVSTELGHFSPMPLPTLYWDFYTKSLPGGATSVTFAGIARDIADAYLRVCNSIGLRVISFSLQPLSIARSALKKTNERTLILDIGAEYTNASVIFKNNELDLSVYIPVGGMHMTNAIAKGLSITADEAEKKKIEGGFTDGAEGTATFMEPVLAEILGEVKKVITYYESTFGFPVDRIVLAGGGSLVPGLEERVTESLEKRVIAISKSGELSEEGVVRLMKKDRDATLYATVVGLGMLGASREFQDLNLISQMPKAIFDEVKTSELFRGGYVSKTRAIRIFFNNRISLGIMVLVILGVAWLFAYQFAEYKLQKGLEELEARPKAVLVREEPVATTTAPVITATTTATTTKATTPKTPVKK